jgi:hypothetical protein
MYFLPWNPIYPAILCMTIGGIISAICRPDLKMKGLVGGTLFLLLYAVFMFGLVWFTPDYIPQVWNLAALSGGLIGGIPPEELPGPGRSAHVLTGQALEIVTVITTWPAAPARTNAPGLASY